MEKLLPAIPVATVSYADALEKFKYFIYIMNMKSDMKISADEVKEYSANYGDMLAIAVGTKRRMMEREIKEHFKQLTEDMNKFSSNRTDSILCDIKNHFETARGMDINIDAFRTISSSAANIGKYPVELISAICGCVIDEVQDTGGNATISMSEKQFTSYLDKIQKSRMEIDHYKEHLKEEFRAKTRFYKALEALEHVLKNMTIDMLEGAGTVKNVRYALDETRFNTKWSSDTTGNLLARVFETMPSGIQSYTAGSLHSLLISSGCDPRDANDIIRENSTREILWMENKN